MAAVNPLRYSNYRYDESTGLYYLMARYYDAGIGGFISRDSFHGFADEPQSLNQYAYVINNPVMYADPSGHFGISVDLAGSIINSFITLIVGGVGYAAIRSFILKKGKSAARRIFTQTIASKLVAWGAPSLAVTLGFIVDTALDYYNFGLYVAKKLDSIDRYKNNGVVGW